MDTDLLKLIGEYVFPILIGGAGVHGAHRLHAKSQGTPQRGPDEPGGRPWESLDEKMDQVLEGQKILGHKVGGIRVEVAQVVEDVRQLGNRVDGLMEWRQVVESRWQRPMKDL